MSAGEFAFLAFGLVLGCAAGAALIEVLRSRPPAPREVRLTVAQDNVPRRASTLASAEPLDGVDPAAFGPGDRRTADGPDLSTVEPAGSPSRTSVRPIASTAIDDIARPVGPSPAEVLVPPLVGIAIEPEPDPLLAALGRPALVAVGAAVGDTGSAGAGAGAAGDDAGPVRAGAAGSDGGAIEPVVGTPGVAGPGTVASTAADARGPADAAPGQCDELRRVADERCAVADGLARQAEAALTALRERQRESDEHETRAARAADECDPRLLRAAKETAQHAFRVASSSAASPSDVEAAARTWLQEINRINGVAREAALTVRREREALAALVPVLERLSIEADAARINSESAREACLSAREALAECEEAARRPPVVASAPLAAPDAPAEPLGVSVVPPATGEPVRDGEAARPPEDEREALEVAAAAGLAAAGEPVLFRLLAGDRIALRDLVEGLAGDDPAERGAWQHELTELIDAIQMRAIEASSLDFPVDHRFWGPFTREQCREIAAALGSLGYRFDGAGGFADDRIPSQRDLSLAVGFAGLDPMRIRRWPNEAEMPELFREVRVAADEYIAATAPGLTLGEMVTLLGRRADGLTDLWNAWGRLRPLLLAPA